MRSSTPRKRCHDCADWAVPGSRYCAAHREAQRQTMRTRRAEEGVGEVRGAYVCGLCKREGHNARACPTRSTRTAPRCSFCMSDAHDTADCRQAVLARARGATCRHCGAATHASAVCTKRETEQVCSGCHQAGHNLRRCPATRCASCGQMGHREDACKLTSGAKPDRKRPCRRRS